MMAARSVGPKMLVRGRDRLGIAMMPEDGLLQGGTAAVVEIRGGIGHAPEGRRLPLIRQRVILGQGDGSRVLIIASVLGPVVQPVEQEVAVDACDSADGRGYGSRRSRLVSEELPAVLRLAPRRAGSLGIASIGRGSVSTKATRERNCAGVQIVLDGRVALATIGRACGIRGIPQADLVGTGGGHELLERGELGLPAELADPAVRQDPRPARYDAAESRRPSSLATSGRRCLHAVKPDGLRRDPVDPSRTEERRGVDALGVNGIELVDARPGSRSPRRWRWAGSGRCWCSILCPSRNSLATAKRWISPPLSSGRSWVGKASNAVTLCELSPPPPTPPWKWHSAHDRALKTGPSPSPCA